MSGEKRTRRTRSYWEPIYNPHDLEPFPQGVIHANHTGCKHATLISESFGDQRKFGKEVFETCDFFGLFESRIFNDCTFNLCDFGLTTWRYSKFSRCRFTKTSFTQTTFHNCEFRDCVWEDIGLAGNETHFRGTVVSNPEKLIEAAYTNLDRQVLDEVGASFLFQKVRLQRTKANVARHLLNVLMTEGEERWYYEAVRVYSNCYFSAAEFDSRLNFVNARKFGKIYWAARIVGYILERFIIKFIGFFNKWGESLVRPSLLGLAIMMSFACVYKIYGFQNTWLGAFVTSAEVTVVAGYTKHANESQCLSTQALYFVNMVLGVFWFAIVVPTLVNRISRVR